MERRRILYRCLLAAWLVLSCGLPAYALQDVSCVAPTYHFRSTSASYNSRVPVATYTPEVRTFKPNANGGAMTTPFTYRISSQGPSVAGGGGNAGGGVSYRSSGSSRGIIYGTGSVSMPVIQFKSTSAYLPAGEEMSIANNANKVLRKPSSWGGGAPGEDDDPIGVLPDRVPVGEPFVLLLMAMAYGVWRRLRCRRVNQ